MNEKLEVTFNSKTSKGKGNVCDACHDIGKVIKLTLPKTKYFDHRNLITIYREYWLCAPCRTKLVHALDYPEDNGWNVPEFTKNDLQAEKESVRE